jgi:hypothetical protein
MEQVNKYLACFLYCFIGIQIHEPVVGVAIGLVSKCADDGSITDHRVLTDILVKILHKNFNPCKTFFYNRVLKIIWVIQILK